MRKERPDRPAPDPELEAGEIQPEYDADLVRRGTRGRYAARFAEGTNVVVLDPDVAAAFPDPEAVNSALRALLEIARRDARSGSLAR